VMLFQQIQYGCLDKDGKIGGRLEKDEYVRPWTCVNGGVGRIESPEHDWDWVNSGRFTGINGKVQPRLEPARVGQFERWRLIHAGTREPVKMQIRGLSENAPDLGKVKGADQGGWMERYCTGEPLPVWQIAMDGLTRSAIRQTETATLFAGERLDAIAHFPAAGRYCLIQDATRVKADPQPLRVIAVIEALGDKVPGEPERRLQNALVDAAQEALPGDAHAALRDKVVGELRDGMKLSSFTWHKPVADAEVNGVREAILNIIETPNRAFFHVNGRAYDHHRMDMVLPLGKAEEWHAVSLLGGHPLHMHVNPFQIVSIENSSGEDVTDPKSPAYDPDYAGLKGEWKDTVFLKQDLRIAFRTRYERFTGDFVTHCHIMFHGDHGMMLNLRIAAESGAAPDHSGP